MRFRPNRHLEEELQRSPGVRAATRAAAGEVKRNAEAIAHGFEETGHYAGSFTVEETDDGYAVGNTDVAGHLIEFGSVNNPPRAPLRRGARAAGLDLREDP